MTVGAEGTSVGVNVGTAVGTSLGLYVDSCEGECVGVAVGENDGKPVAGPGAAVLHWLQVFRQFFGQLPLALWYRH